MSTLALPLVAAADTEALGAALARSCPWDGRAPCSIHLRGELGAGKTTLVQGLLRALGERGVVTSPSYALIEIYTLPVGTVVHADLYRLNSAGEFDELGLADYYAGRTLLLIEWPERAAGRLPAPDVLLELEFADAARCARAQAITGAGQKWLAEMQRQPRPSLK